MVAEGVECKSGKRKEELWNEFINMESNCDSKASKGTSTASKFKGGILKFFPSSKAKKHSSSSSTSSISSDTASLSSSSSLPTAAAPSSSSSSSYSNIHTSCDSDSAPDSLHTPLYLAERIRQEELRDELCKSLQLVSVTQMVAKDSGELEQEEEVQALYSNLILYRSLFVIKKNNNYLFSLFLHYEANFLTSRFPCPFPFPRPKYFSLTISHLISYCISFL